MTSDRLRTRVLGSADADAAAKTLFNVATAARRAMGTGPDGEPLLPPALKTGHYRISEHVTVDTERAALDRRGEPGRCSDEALALYRAALSLVEDEPLAGILSGYGWWQAEGHDRAHPSSGSRGRLQRGPTGERGGIWMTWRTGRSPGPVCSTPTARHSRRRHARGGVERGHRPASDPDRVPTGSGPGSVPSERTERLYAELTRRAV